MLDKLRGKFSQVTLVANVSFKALDASKQRALVVITSTSGTAGQVTSFSTTNLSVGPLFNQSSTPLEIYGDLARGEIYLLCSTALQVGIIEYYYLESDEE